MRNIELKARIDDLDRAEAVCRRLGALFQWTRRQSDVYFRVSDGRLKLRIEEPGGAVLVRYYRPDEAAARECRYELTPVGDPAATLAELEARYGLLVRVVKTRTLYLLDHVRIHLDTVAGLGTFLEFEAVMGQEHSDPGTRELLRRLCGTFSIARASLLAVSYSDLVMGSSS